MSERLAYEKKAAGKSAVAFIPQTTKSKNDLAISLEDDRGGGMPIRVWYLRQLHEEMTNAFVASEGFGVGRMIRVGPRSLQLQNEQIEEEHRAVKMESATGDEWKPGNRATSDPVGQPQRDQLGNFHQSNTIGFVNEKGFGYIKDRNHVAGFIPHEFAGDMPKTFDPT